VLSWGEEGAASGAINDKALRKTMNEKETGRSPADIAGDIRVI